MTFREAVSRMLRVFFATKLFWAILVITLTGCQTGGKISDAPSVQESHEVSSSTGGNVTDSSDNLSSDSGNTAGSSTTGEESGSSHSTTGSPATGNAATGSTSTGTANSGQSGTTHVGFFVEDSQEDPHSSHENPLVFTNAEGVKITLTHAYLTIWSIELGSDCQKELLTSIGHWFLDFWLPPAQAHAQPAPTRLSVPNVIDLKTVKHEPIQLGSIQPPVGQYCNMIVEVMKADSDTQNLPEEINMINKSVWIEGDYVLPHETEKHPLTVTTSRTLFPQHRPLPETLSLNREHRYAEFWLHIDYSRWFDHIDFTLPESQWEDQLLTQIGESIQL